MIGTQERVGGERARTIKPTPVARISDQSIWCDAAKRLLDVSLALVGLLVSSPILLLATTAILVTSPGPILYRHERCGRGGQTFACLKLRTMVADADRLLEQDSTLAAAYRREYKLADDPRVTVVGRILRRTSIDELPQLWNVVLGDMSLVGPRPVTRDEYESMYGQAAATVFSIRPGVTGLWQVSGRSSLPYHQRVALDLHYVQTRSLRTDLKILAKTPACVVRDAA